MYICIIENPNPCLVTPTHVCYVVQSRRRFLFFTCPFEKRHMLVICYHFSSIFGQYWTIFVYITYYILHITCYIFPIDCLLIAYRLPLMPICLAIMDMVGPGPDPRAQKGRRAGAGSRAAPFLGPGHGSRVHIHFGCAYGHQGQSISNQ